MDSALRDADRWWARLPAARRQQIHRMMDPEARDEPLPEHQLLLELPTGTLVPPAS